MLSPSINTDSLEFYDGEGDVTLPLLPILFLLVLLFPLLLLLLLLILIFYFGFYV